ncbi:MAG: MipA/OmpV family protein [Rhodanobacter sp.]|nr:MAG: MipA/OmpV family protein [Rhodanobacter sp.]
MTPPLARSFRRVCLLLMTAGPLWTLPGLAAADSPILAVGAGVQRMPSWPGSNDDQNDPVPYLDINWPGHVSFSTLNGLQVELLHGPVLHGGIYGNYQWGRQRGDLGVLAGRIPSLPPRITGGGYLEWQLTRRIDVGTDLSHDINGAGAYFRGYADWELPSVGLLHHSLSLSWQAMNGAAMNRFFGITPTQASALNVSPWQPAAGGELASLEYDLFVPTSQHTGVALALVYGRLLGQAARSPLVTRYGSRTQLTESVAFVYHL